MLLIGFVGAGVITLVVPVAYGLCALTECVLSQVLVRSPILIRLVPSCAIQLLFFAFVPQLGFFFFIILFIAFAFACLALPARAAAVMWLVVAVVCAAVLSVVPEVYIVPHATPWQRLLVGAALTLTLGRCVVLSVFSSNLRVVLGMRYLSVKESLRSSEDDRSRTAVVLHEDLGQDLVGISLQLAASLSRLQRRGTAGLDELEQTAEQLRATIHKTRILAIASRPAPSAAPPSAREARAAKIAG